MCTCANRCTKLRPNEVLIKVYTCWMKPRYKCIIKFRKGVEQNFNGKKGPLSIVNCVAVYKAQFIWNSLSNQTTFCWVNLRDQLEPIAQSAWRNHDCVDYY